MTYKARNRLCANTLLVLVMVINIPIPSLRLNMEIVASVLTKLATSIKVALMRTYFMIGLNIERSQRSVWLTTILITSNLGVESN